MVPEDISKVLDDLKNRFGSRFIFSFTIAWLLYHWQITVALFWYDKSQFQAEGCKSIFEFISDQLNANSNSDSAFWAALIYTFGLPISKSLINIWDEMIFDFRNWSKTKLVRSQDAKTIKALRIKLEKINDVKLLNGNWKVVTTSNYTTSLTSYEIYIEDYTIYLLNGNEKTVNSHITNFFYNAENKELIFIKDNNDSGTSSYIRRRAVNNLKIEPYGSEKMVLKGQENGVEITYTKYKHEI